VKALDASFSRIQSVNVPADTRAATARCAEPKRHLFATSAAVFQPRRALSRERRHPFTRYHGFTSSPQHYRDMIGATRLPTDAELICSVK
jgi:hypothetical protein